MESFAREAPSEAYHLSNTLCSGSCAHVKILENCDTRTINKNKCSLGHLLKRKKRTSTSRLLVALRAVFMLVSIGASAQTMHFREMGSRETPRSQHPKIKGGHQGIEPGVVESTSKSLLGVLTVTQFSSNFKEVTRRRVTLERSSNNCPINHIGPRMYPPLTGSSAAWLRAISEMCLRAQAVMSLHA